MRALAGGRRTGRGGRPVGRAKCSRGFSSAESSRTGASSGRYWLPVSGMAIARPDSDHGNSPPKRFVTSGDGVVSRPAPSEPASMNRTSPPRSLVEARQAAHVAQACYHELQRRNDAMIARRREAIDRGDLLQSRRHAPEHRHIISELKSAAHDWNLAVARLLDAELNERGY